MTLDLESLPMLPHIQIKLFKKKISKCLTAKRTTGDVQHSAQFLRSVLTCSEHAERLQVRMLLGCPLQAGQTSGRQMLLLSV